MLSSHRAASTALAVLMLSLPASAQTIRYDGDEWRHGTTLNVSGGTAVDSSKARPVGGAAVGWEMTPALAIEGSGTWFDHTGGTEAFAAALKVQVALMSPRAAVPYLETGIGLYRASIDPGASAIPDFYRRRVARSPAGFMVPSTFTDPSFHFGSGVNIFVARHVAIRPGVEATVIRGSSQTHVVTAVTVDIAYHFELHPITPAR